MKRPWTMLVVVSVLALTLTETVAEDWPQWRGPERDGVARGFTLPSRWPDKLNERYRVEVGEGHAAPVIVQGRAYVFSRIKDDEVMRCLDAGSGKELWKHSYAAPYKVDPAARGHGPGPKATPTVFGEKVYTQGMSSQLYCLNAESGKVLWHHDLQKAYQTAGPQYGTSASLLIEGEAVITLVGGKEQGAVVAFDKNTGKELWKTPSDGPAYSAPAVADLAGVRHILTFSRNTFTALAPRDGKVLWQIPFTTAYEQNIVTPLVSKDLVMISGYGKPIQAFRVVKDGPKLSLEDVWKNDQLRMYMSSPVLAGDHVFGHNQRGEVVCLEAKTGKTAWAKGDLGQYASLVLAGDQLLCLDEMAELRVLKADPTEYKEIAKYRVSDSPTWAHLALSQGRFFVKDKTRLICYDLPK